jgi:hypothetical protein
MAEITMNTNNEIRSYISSSSTNMFLAVFVSGFLLLQLIAISNGRFNKTLPIFLFIYAATIFIWYMQRKYAYIAIDLNKKTLNGASFFGFPPNKIPINSIIHVGTRSMFVGGLTVMTVTYILPNGKKKTVNAGGKESLDSNFQKILDALVEINPKLYVPTELSS